MATMSSSSKGTATRKRKLDERASTPSVMATISTTRKRKLDEVVPPTYVAREDEGGAYGPLEMEKRFVRECVMDKNRYIDDKILSIEAENARMIAESNRVFSRSEALIRWLIAENAARDAAAAAAAAPPPSI